ncbi:hypothetical protein HanRHA438_Chr08g0352301 [Helianthus annuus]|nr:hypothetical protein HanIR_Chr08g0368081 [Helianthus annuus]KAJ0553670.1 hypothetical protein HanHA89_Chr08g0298931 [Helianthus annuus]KAJ0719331.1 hypothetical protein HanLR1_Chr08g0280471 [Helianthus annuus]KAJ0898039.1 hypothetical protein HanRHA438_Chr08g0352301 [Helianthus annuus]KAJ0901783.1 hypothetical protein HanPSC8_Chr08g0329281 [Helianthus annuus]
MRKLPIVVLEHSTSLVIFGSFSVHYELNYTKPLPLPFTQDPAHARRILFEHKTSKALERKTGNQTAKQANNTRTTHQRN